MSNRHESNLFRRKVQDLERDLETKKLISQQTWISEQPNSLNPSFSRIEHRHNLSYHYKKIFNFLHRDELEDTSDQNKCSNIFQTNLLNLNSFKSNKEHDIQDILLYQIPKKQHILCSFIYSLPFQIFLTSVICLNSIMLGVQTDSYLKKEYQSVLEFLDSFSNAVFLVEFILKISYNFKIYFYNLWNIFDFFLLFIGLISLLTDLEYSKSFGASRLFRIFRVLRALRSLRSLHILSKMQLIINTFFKSIYDVINIVALILLSMIMFSLFGCNFFSSKVNEYFKDLDTGMLSIFYCSTREGLSDLFNAISDPTDFYMEITWKFFVIILIILFAFILTNLIVAVVVTNMQQALKDEERKDPIQNDEESKYFIDENLEREFNSNIKIPILTSYLEDLSLERLEKYFLILDCLEENLNEYSKIYHDLDKIINVVEDLNTNFDLENEVLNFDKQDYEEQVDDFSSRKSDDVDWENFANNGDILSNLMDLEKKNLFSSEKFYDFKSMAKASMNKALYDINLESKRSRLRSLEQLDKSSSKDLFKNNSDMTL
ncbi:cation channel sperm-associated 4 [Brachionus plicatilis]|uniref:Cation channel sperm-associated 4 n=1 Tax=Brachionus plicatilis TaxID=10195 RepID=A0A3M7SYV8_BRAPC|nr:cation channel sperm-associated 4 [Brachionus plicatilis]